MTNSSLSKMTYLAIGRNNLNMSSA